ncbi:MAG: membrane protein insertase YidC [Holosporales bacterium]|jgi:YidC/Oxa1 family membrane protein insertase|nr:membrane protein insertase YidC [Holosporales bacterium]
MNESKNFILAVVLMCGVLVGWQYFTPEQPTPATKQADSQPVAHHQDAAVSSANIPVAAQNLPAEIIDFESSELSGQISLRGIKIADIKLRKYKESINKDSGPVVLFKESGQESYYAEAGWASIDKHIKLPDENTVWSTNSKKLSPSSPLILTWDNGQGLVFKRTIEIDGKNLITVKQDVLNNGSQSLKISAYVLIRRVGLPEGAGRFAMIHEGGVGYFGGKLHEVSYDKMAKEALSHHGFDGGWAGITDKYWLSAIIPTSTSTIKFREISGYGKPTYQVDTLTDISDLAPGGVVSSTSHIFLGAKDLDVLDGYEQKLGIKHFDLAIDFGWFYFITRPLFLLLDWLSDNIANMGLIIIIMTLLFKLAFFPLANKSYRSMNKMREIGPKLKSIQQFYANDRARLSQETMNLYKKEKVNPLGGCLPQLIQFPILFALYKVFSISIDIRHCRFLWIGDLSEADPTSVLTLFGLIPITLPDFLCVGVLPILMGLTMLIQQKMGPAPADPTQAKMFLIMPIVFTFMMAQFPAGVILYWTLSNILSIVQQWAIGKLSKTSKS